VSPRLVLASGSPRRAHILTTLGIPFRVRVTNADEALLPGEQAGPAAERLARAKAAAALPEPLPVLAADTLVACEGHILGKPADAAEAGAMLRRLSGRRHEVVTGVCLALGGRFFSARAHTAVTMARLSESEIAWYVGTGEPLDKAGAYHMDGRGAAFVEAIDGSPSNVVGLPVRLLMDLAHEAGVDLGLGG
jgi:septum formation protein